MAYSADGSACECPVCGGPAKESQVWIDTWRGGSEQFTVWLCEDDSCEAHHPMVSRNL